MIAKYPGKCFICSLPITPGKDNYDAAQKGSSHAACEEAFENQPPTREQFELAEQLGYRHYDPGESPEGLLRRMLPADRQ